MLWVGAAVAVLALVGGGVVVATRSSPPPAPSPSTSIRAVALGDSVPYGHGLANPYLTPRVGLPATWVSQPPSTRAYPSEVARALGLTMTREDHQLHVDRGPARHQRGRGRRR